MRVVIGYEPTPWGEAAFDRGLDEAILRQADLAVIGRSGGTGTLEPLRSRCQQANVTATFDEDDDLDYADRLVDASYEADVDLIVLGVKRRSPVGKLLVGSIAQRVLLDGNCPILAVKAPVEVA